VFSAAGSIRESLASNLNTDNMGKFLFLVSSFKNIIWKLAHGEFLYFSNVKYF